MDFIYWFITNSFKNNFISNSDYEHNLRILLEILMLKAENITNLILKHKPELKSFIKRQNTEQTNKIKEKDGDYWIFMDFNPEEEWKYEAAKTFFAEKNIDLKRMDKAYKLGNQNDPIITRIKNAIEKSKLCIFDISTNNSNVFLELGYAWALNKDYLIFNIESNIKVPFNVAAHTYHKYKTSSDIRKKLKDYLDL